MTQDSAVAEMNVTEVQARPPTATVAPDTNPVPVIVIKVPPIAGPEVGDTETNVGAGTATKVAVTEVAAEIDTVHVGFEPSEAHAPPHESNCEKPVGFAVSVTDVPAPNE